MKPEVEASDLGLSSFDVSARTVCSANLKYLGASFPEINKILFKHKLKFSDYPHNKHSNTGNILRFQYWNGSTNPLCILQKSIWKQHCKPKAGFKMPGESQFYLPMTQHFL